MWRWWDTVWPFGKWTNLFIFDIWLTFFLFFSFFFLFFLFCWYLSNCLHEHNTAACLLSETLPEQVDGDVHNLNGWPGIAAAHPSLCLTHTHTHIQTHTQTHTHHSCEHTLWLNTVLPPQRQSRGDFISYFTYAACKGVYQTPRSEKNYKQPCRKEKGAALPFFFLLQVIQLTSVC